MNIPTSLSPAVKTLINNYLNLQIGGKSIACPYYINRKPVRLNLFFNYTYDGKGTPEEIKKITIKKAHQTNFDLNSSTPEQIRKFMKRKGIGIDCTGLAYQILNTYSIASGKPRLSQYIHATPSPNPLSYFRPLRYKLNAKTLTSPVNSRKIEDINKIQIGDMIYLHMEIGEHILIIIEKISKQITYIHSSRKTKQTGVHLGKINIIQPDKNLKYQQWLELDNQNRPINQKYFNPELGDSVYRLKH